MLLNGPESPPTKQKRPRIYDVFLVEQATHPASVTSIIPQFPMVVYTYFSSVFDGKRICKKRKYLLHGKGLFVIMYKIFIIMGLVSVRVLKGREKKA